MSVIRIKYNHNIYHYLQLIKKYFITIKIYNYGNRWKINTARKFKNRKKE